MRVQSRFSIFIITLHFVLLFASQQVMAWGVNYQCPANLLTENGYLDVKNPANSSDPGCTNPYAMDFFDTCKPLIDPVTGQPSGATTDPNVVCRAIVCGDGHIYMADRDRTGSDPDAADTYIFGFSDVTGVPEELILTSGMPMNRGAAQFSAPTFFAREGQEFYLTLTNSGMLERPDLFDAHTVHYHGFPNAAPVFDGEPMASFGISMGDSLTYYYNNVNPGTYMWHCHVEAAEHMQMGMLGNLFILAGQDGTIIEYPAGSGKNYNKFAFNDCPTPNPNPSMCGSTGYDVMYFLQETGIDPDFHYADHTYNKLDFANMTDTYGLLNGRGYPDTVNPEPIANVNGYNAQPVPAIPFTINPDGSRSPLAIPVGQKLLIRLSSLSTVDFYTVTVLGIPMRVVGQGAQLLRGPTGINTAVTTGSVMLGGGEAVDIILDTTNVAPGTYFLYTTNLNALSNDAEDFGGMMTEITVTGPAV
jgi:FtsP/CotA-like multicopper oxidase with cupredoxin domain